MRCCCNCDGPRTPQELLDETGADIFQLLFFEMESTTYRKMQAALWHRFRYRRFGSCDMDFWVTCAHDLLLDILQDYKIKCEMWDEVRSKLDIESFREEIQNPVSSQIIRESTTTGSSESSQEHEDFPDTVLTETNYLSDKDSGTSRSESSGNSSDKHLDGPYTERVARLMAAFRPEDNPYLKFAREFDSLFSSRLF